MTTPKATKLASGKWRCRVMLNGERISVTGRTEREAIRMAMDIQDEAKIYRACGATLSQAIDKYIDARSNTLSPSSLRGYRIIQRNRFLPYQNIPLTKMTADAWQRAVNEESKQCSAKTLKNAWGLARSVIKNETGQDIFVRLPQVIREDKPYLNAEQLPVFLDAIKGRAVEIPALLGLSSLRRSEILAVTWDDIDFQNNRIFVRGSVVPNELNQLVQKKENKNTTSRRTIPFILPQLRCALEACSARSGAVVTMHPDGIRKQINSICRANNLPEIGIHGCRRSYASLMYSRGVPERVCQAVGGWSDTATMHKIYIKLSENDIGREAEAFTSYFDGL